MLGSYKIWVPFTVVLAITLSIYQRSFQTVTSTATDALNERPFVPSRLDSNPFGAKDTLTADEPKRIDKPLNVVIMYGDDWRHDAIVSKRCNAVYLHIFVLVSCQRFFCLIRFMY